MLPTSGRSAVCGGVLVDPGPGLNAHRACEAGPGYHMKLTSNISRVTPWHNLMYSLGAFMTKGGSAAILRMSRIEFDQ